ncbi:TetR family transcriptional regulator [Paraburkholderia tropica]|uniref:TetR/AcrR family transcriptional regulator n=1 Tax=Paraburkholderia tropica TaxID=92647 RepID=UPI001CB052E2|nr:TetR/AcrR family transcriptional regulator [Paraburkholderia tropica]CAG9234403.1 TetR family transcriptional regulator [Paraburkholderia tropica]
MTTTPRGGARRRPTPLDARKQPKQRRSAATVDAILEAAARILETRGPDGYTTNAIAERAGVSVGSLYQYFPNRDALTAALIDRESAPLLVVLEHAGAASSCEAALREVIRASVEHQMRRPVLARVLDFEEARLPLGERDQRVSERLHATLLHAFGLADAPRLPDVETAAHDVYAIVRGMVDAAGARGETDAAALEMRATHAVVGYLLRSACAA